MVARTNPTAGTKLHRTILSSGYARGLVRAYTPASSRPLVLRVNETYLPANPVKSLCQSEGVAEGHIVHLIPAVDDRRVDCCRLRIVITGLQRAIMVIACKAHNQR